MREGHNQIHDTGYKTPYYGDFVKSCDQKSPRIHASNNIDQTPTYLLFDKMKKMAELTDLALSSWKY